MARPGMQLHETDRLSKREIIGATTRDDASRPFHNLCHLHPAVFFKLSTVSDVSALLITESCLLSFYYVRLGTLTSAEVTACAFLWTQ